MTLATVRQPDPSGWRLGLGLVFVPIALLGGEFNSLAFVLSLKGQADKRR
jgi:hypothetical protein